jgi:hypothetical protein
MKTAVVTGHTSGIGKSIYEYFQNNGYMVVGFSKSTGCDISKKQDRDNIIHALLSADIFVNNAYNNFDDSQFELLNAAFVCWSSLDKLIINISSAAGGKMQTKYAFSKKQQDDFCLLHLYDLPKIINLKPGLTDTERVNHIAGNRMTTNNIIDVLDFILKSTDRIHISAITFRAP